MNTVATAAHTLPERVSGLPLFPSVYSPDDWATLPIGRGPGRQELQQGYGLGRKVHSLDLKANPNTLVFGGTGSGKGVLLRQIAAAAITRGHDVYVIDPVRQALNFRDICPWLAGTVTDLTAAATTLESLLVETSRRTEMMTEHRTWHWSDLPDVVRATEGIWPITVIIDEYSALTAPYIPTSKAARDALDPAELRELQEADETASRILSNVRKIVQRARYAGIHVVTGTQRPDELSFGGANREHFGNVIHLLRDNTNPESLRAVFGIAAKDVLAAVDGTGDLSLKGAAVAVDGAGTVSTFRVAYSTSEQLTDGLRECLGETRAGAEAG